MKNRFLTQLSIGVCVVLTQFACEKESDPVAAPAQFVVGMEAATETDVLLSAASLTEGTISPIGQGFEQPAWMLFYQMGNTVVATGYSSDNEMTGYRMQEDGLTAIGSLITELGIYAVTNVDDNTMLAMGVTRAGYEDRILYVIDKNDMSIVSRTKTRIDERQAEGLVAWPTGLKVRGGQLFVAYYLMGSGEDPDIPAFATPNSNQARVAVYSYPSLTFEKIITDNRTSDIGNYTSEPSLIAVENGDIYSFSTSSLASGFAPTPTNPSGFLKIENGATSFSDYFFDFEDKSGGYKINNAVYAGNGKMVVRMVQEDTGLWATYNPKSDAPICSIAIADLHTKTVTKVAGVPLHGGEWGMSNLVHNGKVYLNISDSESAAIYEIDPTTATAVKGASIEGNWVKGIFAL